MLRTLQPGDRVYVGRANGTMAVFTVTAVQKFAKDQFPTANFADTLSTRGTYSGTPPPPFISGRRVRRSGRSHR